MSDELLDVLLPSKLPSRTLASAGRRARPAFASPLQTDPPRPSNAAAHTPIFTVSPSPPFSDNSEPESDGSDRSDDEEENLDRGELRRKFFEGLVAEWKSRRNIARPRITADAAHTIPSYHGHALGNTKPNKLSSYHNHYLHDGAGRTYTTTVRLSMPAAPASNSGNSSSSGTNGAGGVGLGIPMPVVTTTVTPTARIEAGATASTTRSQLSSESSQLSSESSQLSSQYMLTPEEQELWSWIPTWGANIGSGSSACMGTGVSVERNQSIGYTSTLMTFPDNSASLFLNDTNSTNIPTNNPPPTPFPSLSCPPSSLPASSLAALSSRALTNANAFALYTHMLAMPTGHVNISAYTHPPAAQAGNTNTVAGTSTSMGDDDRASFLTTATSRGGRAGREGKDDAFAYISASHGPIVADVLKQVFASDGGNQSLSNGNGTSIFNGFSRGNGKSGNNNSQKQSKLKNSESFPRLQFSSPPLSLSPLLCRPSPPPPLLFRCHLGNTIKDVFMGKGWVCSQSETNWTIGWVGRPWVRGVYSKIHLDPHQRVNHFRNFFELTRKDALAKNVKRLRRIMQIRERDHEKEKERERGEKERERAIVPASSSFQPSSSPLTMVAAGSLYTPLLTDNQRIPEYFSVNFIPDTYILPKEYKMFLEAFKRSSAPSWIMKPVARCQGQGIFLFDKLRAVQDWARANATANGAGGGVYAGTGPNASTGTGVGGGNGGGSSNASAGNGTSSSGGGGADGDAGAEVYVVQEYLANPLLIGGKKFDMRIYVLVSSFDPLTVWLCREGFGRFSGSRFSMTKEDRGNNYVHLTNVAVQKGGQGYDDDSGGKWDIRSIKLFVASTRGQQQADAMMVNVQDAILKSLLSAQETMVNDETSFALYGFDIMLDNDLRAWVIEVNACPSLTANTAHDYYLKYSMLSDALAIVDPDCSRTRREVQVGCWDLILRGDKVMVGAGGIGGRPLMAALSCVQRELGVCGGSGSNAGGNGCADKEVRLMGNLDYIWREKQHFPIGSTSGRSKNPNPVNSYVSCPLYTATTNTSNANTGNSSGTGAGYNAAALLSWLERPLPKDMYACDRYLAGYGDYAFARTVQANHVLAVPAFPCDSSASASGSGASPADNSTSISSAADSTSTSTAEVLLPDGTCIFGLQPRACPSSASAHSSSPSPYTSTSSTATIATKGNRYSGKNISEKRYEEENPADVFPNGLAHANSIIPSLLGLAPAPSSSPLLLPLPASTRPVSSLPLYTQGHRIHANLPISVAMVDAGSAPVSALTQVSLLGSYNDRLTQLPYMYAAMDCFHIIHAELASTSSSSFTNAHDTTALAVGLRPAVAKRPIFK